MTVGAETIVSDEWLDAFLKSDVDITAIVLNHIYDGLADLDAPYPHVVYSTQDERDIRGVSASRIMVDVLYQVRGVAQVDSYSPLKPLANAIDKRLNGARAQTVDGYVFECVRESPYRLTEQHQGYQIRHVGGLYRVLVQGNS
jgi:hypothetical protein